MRARTPPRYMGKITSWKDEQGFGFITPNGGGPAVFVHVKSFSSRGARPVEDTLVTYLLTTNEKGQPRAEQVAFVRDRTARPDSMPAGARTLVIAAAFLVLIALLVVAGKLPRLVFALYLGMSALAFIAYAIDKSAARNNRRRTRESTLHMLGLFGGWPGALVASHLLRHKSKKEAFRVTLWASVMLHCGALAWFLTPWGPASLQMLGVR